MNRKILSGYLHGHAYEPYLCFVLQVRNLTNNIQFILETVGTSTVVEVQGDKVRRHNDWKNWPPLTSSSSSPNSSTKPNPDVLAARLTNIRMEEGSTYRPDESEGYGSH
ncbi:hypothetical protein Taro_048515 [Colocasia esculenta]|uniref:Uncharacterized protein n=1 Tax=Colocasia esculenta TaxID=4460 RepID=A0A843X8C6_COLES|nr:hypothetical protein [Colocasia esculenta]